MNHKKRILSYLIYFILLTFLFEFTLRLFFSVSNEKYEISSNPSILIEDYYPGIEKALSDEVIENNDVIDILFLGGSVLHPIWGTIEEELKKKLISTYSCKINIINLSRPSHTSLDSKIKYELLQNKQYDIILLYHGINEVRFNNCPKSIFDNNYSHVEFYNKINAITNPIAKFSILPYTFNTIKIGLLNKFGNELLSVFKPKEEWLQYGSEIKTAKVFHKNYKTIVDIAKSNNTSVIIPSFAYYPPKGYSQSDLIKNKLDSNKLISPIEIWGKKENVLGGIKAHNKTIENLFIENRQRENIFTIDMDSSLTKNNDNFNDICHFTSDGSVEFVSIVFPIFKSIIDKNKLCQTNNIRH